MELTTDRSRSHWLALALAFVLAAIGLALAAGGIWLITLGGSAYYAIAGIALCVTAWLLFRGSVASVWLYGAVFLATVVWAFWETGADAWALVPRIVGPAVLLVLVLLVAPLLRKAPFGWKGALVSAVGIVIVIALGFVVTAQSGPDAVKRDLPGRTFASGAPGSAASDWPAYGGTQGAQHYSALAQITPENVARLERAWVAHTGDLPDDMEDNSYGAETTPLKVGDTLYLCSAMNVLIALDPATGQERWRYDPQVSPDWIPYTAACRGVAYHAAEGADPAEPCATRIVEGTLDARIVAVDARTGRPCAGFGTNGSVNITEGMGRVIPGMVSITSPPVIVRDVIVTGHQVLDGQRNDAPSGVIQAFDVETGELAWAWDLGATTAAGDAADGPRTYTRGTPNMWTIASADEELGLAYLPMGNSAVDYWSSDRSPQENEFSTALVALDVETGEPAWHFQTVHKDVWDYDLGSQPTLVDLPGGVPAVVLASKQGDIYVLDRRTGRLITRAEERPVPQGGVEPAERTPTQPFSLFHTLAKPALTERDMWGMSPLDQLACRIQFRRAEYRGMYTPPTSDRRWIQYPGYNGGSDWGGIAVDPVRGVIVANYNDMPNYNRLVPRAEADAQGWTPRGDARGGDMGGGAEGAGDPQAGTPYAIDVNAGWRLPFTGLLCKEPPYGGIRAIDLRTGETIWDRSFGTARRNGPFGIPSMLPLAIGTPNNGGSVVTAGGLIFIAAATDNLFRAIDLRTGETLWEDVLPAGGQATPMTYEANGRQYVVIMAGGHHFMETPIGDELIAYALPD